MKIILFNNIKLEKDKKLMRKKNEFNNKKNFHYNFYNKNKYKEKNY